MGQGSPLSIDRFSPSPGLFVDRTGKKTTIAGAMEMHGPESTPARAATAQTSINTTWTSSFADGTSVVCTIVVRHRPKGVARSPVTQIEALAMKGPSYVHETPRGRAMKLNVSDPDAFNWTAAHEFGHILGLDDRYSESLASKIRGALGGKRTTSVDAGYAGNIMAVDQGALEARNLVDFADETAPRRGKADDRVRNWIRTHSVADLRGLSNDTKIAMIGILIEGFVSDADIRATERICETVFMRADAQAMWDELVGPAYAIGRRGPRERVLEILAALRAGA
ncbi:MAG: hypothetical protein JNK46_13605 [Methylobacteriaceae bacterium]|nr:hypothetical protein [Methylobacteriaceae bacterium]